MRLTVALLFLALGLGVAAVRMTGVFAESRQVVVDIAPGTAEAIRMGNAPESFHTIELMVGVHDVLVIHNNDDELHQFGPYLIRPGHSVSQYYSRPGRVVQSCTLVPDRQVEIVVHPRTFPASRVPLTTLSE